MTVGEPPTQWRHGRWYEPHPAVPDPRGEWVQPLTGRLMTGCLTCREALIGPQVASPVEGF